MSTALPGRAAIGGYLYVVEYSSSLIKVGRTVDPRTRLSVHRQLGEAFSVTIARTWLSPVHESFTKTEKVLIGLAAAQCSASPLAEYFHGVDFDLLVEQANAIPFDVLDLDAHIAAVKTARMPVLPPPPIPLIDIEDLAERIGREPAEIKAMVRARSIPFCRLGKHIRFSHVQVAEIERLHPRPAAA